MQIAQNISLGSQALALQSTGRDFADGQGMAVRFGHADFGKKFNEDTGNRRADVVNSNSPMPPRGTRIFDAPVTKQNVPFRTYRRTEGMRNDG